MKTVSAALVAAAIALGGSTLRAADELAVKKVLSPEQAPRGKRSPAPRLR